MFGKLFTMKNCFQENLHEMCTEERIFNRMISGLHTSISTQLSVNYIDFDNNKSYPNIQMFFEKVGDHPDRILNLYFAYSVVLRAINRAMDHIKNHEYNTGDFQSDMETRLLIDKLYEITSKKCDYPFNETELFSDITEKSVKTQFISYFHNISRIMDCVECEKCKVYGKLQTYGIAAAFKILFAERLEGVDKIHLQRNELIALINTLAKLSSSLDSIDKMYQKRYDHYWGMTKALSACLFTLLVFIWCALKIYKQGMEKLRKNLSVLNSFQQE